VPALDVDTSKTLERNVPGMNHRPASEIQRQYYAETADRYDAMHVHAGDEHYFALGVMLGAVDFCGIESVLDIGSGTGRAIAHLKRARPALRVKGVEPVGELRDVGHRNSISREDLIAGDALALPFEDGAFDLVCEYGVLHHIKTPERVVAEMLRVAKKAVFIADCNNFGQGNALVRMVKQTINALGLWPLVDFVKTRGRGYTISEGDGLAYSYSVFNDYDQIRAQCRSVHLINTIDAGINPYRTATHVALLGVKQ
jgi:ubiquinone/menaquinone biosynthesis C-methylase UbiE